MLLVGGIVLIVVVGGYFLYNSLISPAPSINDLEAELVLNDLAYEDYVTSPLSFSGSASSEWFDAQGEFSIEVRDFDGTVLGTGKARAEGSTFAKAQVPFTAAVEFVPSSTKEGSVWLFRSGTFGGNEDSFSYGVTVSFVPVEKPTAELEVGVQE